jgi:hypothetical protein
MGKSVFSEFLGDNGAKNACGNIASEALGACWAESQLEGCTAEQALCFCAAVLLGGDSLEVDWIDRHQVSDRFRGPRWGRGEGARKKIGNNIFQSRLYSCT